MLKTDRPAAFAKLTETIECGPRNVGEVKVNTALFRARGGEHAEAVKLFDDMWSAVGDDDRVALCATDRVFASGQSPLGSKRGGGTGSGTMAQAESPVLSPDKVASPTRGSPPRWGEGSPRGRRRLSSKAQAGAAQRLSLVKIPRGPYVFSTCC